MPVVALASLLAIQARTTLLYQPKVGSSYKFAVTSSIKNQTGTANISASSNVKILSHQGNIYKVETKLTDVKNGGKMVKGGLQASTTVLDYDKYGAVKTIKNGSGQVIGGFNNQALGMQFPQKPVKVGDTWTNTVDLGSVFTATMKAGSKASGKVNLVFKLIELHANDAVVTCNLKGTIAMDLQNQLAGKPPQKVQAQMSIVGKGQYTLERSTGVYYASNMTMEVVTSTGKRSFSSTQSVSMKRL